MFETHRMLGQEHERELLATAERANAGKDVGRDPHPDLYSATERGARMVRAGLAHGRLPGYRTANVSTEAGEGEVGPA
jgi:hypothetical protein